MRVPEERDKVCPSASFHTTYFPPQILVVGLDTQSLDLRKVLKRTAQTILYYRVYTASSRFKTVQVRFGDQLGKYVTRAL